MTVGRSFWVVLILLAVCLTLANLPLALDPVYQSLYYHISYLWGLLIIVCWVWSLLALRWLSIDRQARTLRQQVGEIFEERFTVRNDSRLPKLWVELRDETSLPGAAGSRVLTWIGGNRTRSYMAHVWLSQRGQFSLGPTEFISGDVFGLFRVKRRIPTNACLLVVPYMVNLRYFPSPQGLLPGGKALRQRTLEVSPYAASVREFTPGDPLNRIHWASTARRERLMVKEFEQDPQADVWIFVDAQRFVNVSIEEDTTIIQHDEAYWLWKRPTKTTLPQATIEYSISAAASVANYFIRQGQAVGMVCAGQSYITLSAERGERQLGKILDTLAFIKPEGELPLHGLVAAQIRHLSRGSTIILVTSSTQPEVVLAASELLYRGMRPVVVLIEAVSFGGLKGTDRLQANLANQDIAVFKIANHDDLATVLEGGSKAAFTSGYSWWKEPN